MWLERPGSILICGHLCWELGLLEQRGYSDCPPIRKSTPGISSLHVVLHLWARYWTSNCPQCCATGVSVSEGLTLVMSRWIRLCTNVCVCIGKGRHVLNALSVVIRLENVYVADLIRWWHDISSNTDHKYRCHFVIFTWGRPSVVKDVSHILRTNSTWILFFIAKELLLYAVVVHN